MPQNFKVIFKNNFDEQTHSLDDARQALIDRLAFSEAILEKLLSAPRSLIKRTDTQEEAEQLADFIKQIGFDAEYSEIPQSDSSKTLSQKDIELLIKTQLQADLDNLSNSIKQQIEDALQNQLDSKHHPEIDADKSLRDEIADKVNQLIESQQAEIPSLIENEIKLKTAEALEKQDENIKQKITQGIEDTIEEQIPKKVLFGVYQKNDEISELVNNKINDSIELDVPDAINRILEESNGNIEDEIEKQIESELEDAIPKAIISAINSKQDDIDESLNEDLERIIPEAVLSKVTEELNSREDLIQEKLEISTEEKLHQEIIGHIQTLIEESKHRIAEEIDSCVNNTLEKEIPQQVLYEIYEKNDDIATRVRAGLDNLIQQQSSNRINAELDDLSSVLTDSLQKKLHSGFESELANKIKKLLLEKEPEIEQQLQDQLTNNLQLATAQKINATLEENEETLNQHIKNEALSHIETGLPDIILAQIKGLQSSIDQQLTDALQSQMHQTVNEKLQQSVSQQSDNIQKSLEKATDENANRLIPQSIQFMLENDVFQEKTESRIISSLEQQLEPQIKQFLQKNQQRNDQQISDKFTEILDAQLEALLNKELPLNVESFSQQINDTSAEKINNKLELSINELLEQKNRLLIDQLDQSIDDTLPSFISRQINQLTDENTIKEKLNETVEQAIGTLIDKQTAKLQDKIDQGFDEHIAEIINKRLDAEVTQRIEQLNIEKYLNKPDEDKKENLLQRIKSSINIKLDQLRSIDTNNISKKISKNINNTVEQAKKKSQEKISAIDTNAIKSNLDLAVSDIKKSTKEKLEAAENGELANNLNNSLNRLKTAADKKSVGLKQHFTKKNLTIAASILIAIVLLGLFWGNNASLKSDSTPQSAQHQTKKTDNIAHQRDTSDKDNNTDLKSIDNLHGFSQDHLTPFGSFNWSDDLYNGFIKLREISPKQTFFNFYQTMEDNRIGDQYLNFDIDKNHIIFYDRQSMNKFDISLQKIADMTDDELIELFIKNSFLNQITQFSVEQKTKFTLIKKSTFPLIKDIIGQYRDELNLYKQVDFTQAHSRQEFYTNLQSFLKGTSALTKLWEAISLSFSSIILTLDDPDKAIYLEESLDKLLQNLKGYIQTYEYIDLNENKQSALNFGTLQIYSSKIQISGVPYSIGLLYQNAPGLSLISEDAVIHLDDVDLQYLPNKVTLESQDQVLYEKYKDNINQLWQEKYLSRIENQLLTFKTDKLKTLKGQFEDNLDTAIGRLKYRRSLELLDWSIDAAIKSFLTDPNNINDIVNNLSDDSGNNIQRDIHSGRIVYSCEQCLLGPDLQYQQHLKKLNIENAEQQIKGFIDQSGGF